MNKLEKFNILKAIKLTEKEAKEYVEIYASRRSKGGASVGTQSASRKAKNEELKAIAKHIAK